MLDYILNIQLNSYLAICLYWIPLVLCFMGYSVRTWKDIQHDIQVSREPGYYSPRITYGVILGRIVWSFVPVVNLIVLVFDVGIAIISSVTKFIVRVFDTPVIQRRK